MVGGEKREEEEVQEKKRGERRKDRKQTAAAVSPSNSELPIGLSSSLHVCVVEEEPSAPSFSLPSSIGVYNHAPLSLFYAHGSHVGFPFSQPSFASERERERA